MGFSGGTVHASKAVSYAGSQRLARVGHKVTMPVCVVSICGALLPSIQYTVAWEAKRLSI